ncbi:YppE family protein [Bacillus sp. FJAT-27251]|uniref:YppE family protein n=1 Tax=Bacillus sp. FJAT-27251 TaxID=1684142 RepID=UPI0006A7D89A|nr:YppE family protein [Bacillus sp. FJAT-27251]
MSGNHRLKELTELMLEYSGFILNRFEQAKAAGEKGDFFEEVKPFADEVRAKAGEWKAETLVWLEQNPQRNLHPKQIDATADNIEMVSIQAFFPETSRKRFMGHIQSIDYVLGSLLDLIEK